MKQLTSEPKKPEGKTGTSSRAEPQKQEKTTASGSHLNNMLKKQTTNFKAFMHTVGTININQMQNKWEFEDALHSLQTRWSIIDSCHWEIENESNEENLWYQNDFIKHEQIFNQIKKSINNEMCNMSHREKSTPQMDIPTFSGNYHQWMSFKDLFNETIHKNPSISNAQKMQYLKGKITGEAERLIHHLQISSENYDVCWEILNHRYDNKKLIFTTHINTMLGLPNMQHQSMTAIKKLHDITKESLHAITSLGVDITTWDPLLVHLLSQKLDSDSFSEYIESVRQPREMPVLREFLQFLENKFTALEASRRKQDTINQRNSIQPHQSFQRNSFSNQRNHPNYPINYKQNYNNLNNSTKVMKSLHVSQPFTCTLCNSEHGLWKCVIFLRMSDEQKLNTINELNYCKNCLINHFNKHCNSSKRCRKCFGLHNTLLHEALIKPEQTTSLKHNKKFAPNLQKREQEARTSSTHASWNDTSEILLSTAMINVTAKDGTQLTMRALIDQGSQISLITENAAQRLGLKRYQCKGKIFGVGEKENHCKGKGEIELWSLYNNFRLKTNVIIMNNLIKNLPNSTFIKPSYPHIQNIKLADPEFNESRPIDLLLGAEVYSKILLEGIRRGNTENEPIAQQTQLGWLLCGCMTTTFNCNVVLQNIDDLKRFWETEDITDHQMEMSNEDQECLQYFLNTTKRLPNGKYEVRLPFKQNLKETLGSNKHQALAQFRNLERKLQKDTQIKTEYENFMNEYLHLGHMTPSKAEATPEYYLPHHAVNRSESTTTKLRVVFNASSKSTSGVSLNDIMHRGPNLQKDLQELILKWRTYKFAYKADIEKMYRQIMIHQNDQTYQKIIWRESLNQPIRTFQLTTVTYGTKPAPFLAMMCLKQLAQDERDNFPEAANILEECFYMDDYCGGCHSMENAKKLRNQLIMLLKRGGFNLRKWNSNEPELLTDLGVNQYNQQQFEFKEPHSTKTLGLGWNPLKDIFIFDSKIGSQSTITPTKRTLLSDISKLFDPLGWLTPISISMKMLFQKVWLLNLEWDDKLPEEISRKWTLLRQELQQINTIEVKRWLGVSEHNQSIELHGFCDASSKSYACVIYCKIIKNNDITVTLVAAKARLTPINKVISVPRLELMGALLLSKLMYKVQRTFSDHDVKLFCWSDSTAVLGWLQGPPSRWKAFVANRVKLITKIIPPDCWQYIKTNENPADCATRGVSIQQLKDHELWWQGPKWLPLHKEPINNEIQYETNLETKPAVLIVINQEDSNNTIINQLLNKYSSINKTIRIIAWILRFSSTKKKVRQPHLTLHELRSAKRLVIKFIQHTEFTNDLDYLQKHKKVHSKSNILNLNPILDQDGILRVGGRLKNAQINLEMQHPIILPHNHRLTTLLIQEAHELTFHGGARLTLANLRQKYWIIGGYMATKKFIRKCVICEKQTHRKQYQLMGDLPTSRVNPEKPFYHCGVDYTGFVEVKANKGRGIRTTKGYIAIFVCMVTKAVHIELVSNLSSSAFLAALTRMAARRGTPRHIYSDNGTNFVGANKILQEEYTQLKEIFDTNFLSEVTEMGIEWHFNAPSWPNAGGLWERAVRSLKQHLKKVIGVQKLTFEEYATLLSKLEACLNSRPLCAMTEDPEDIDFLTPAHFLIARPGLTVIETERDARTRWHLITKLFQDLWKRWNCEYLTQLSARNKWMETKKNITIGDLVVIHEDNLPPGRWLMGRVLDTHPGHDGLVRVVTLKTKNGIIKRPIIKLSILPINPSNDSSQPQSNTQPNNPPNKQSGVSEPDERRGKRTTRPKFMSVATSILLFMTLFLPSYGMHNVNQFPNNQTLYFDPIAKVQLIRDKWNLVVYYDMEPYWAGIEVYNKITHYLERLCTTIEKQSPCNMIIRQANHDYLELEYYNELLLTQHFNVHDRQRRRKRGLINGVGYLANDLFGVLDSRFAEQYTKDIETIRSNYKHLTNLWKNQTSVIESEFNLMKKMEATIETQHKLINQKLINLEKVTNTVQSEIRNMSYIQDFILSAMVGNNLLQSLKRLQETLLDTITDLYHGQISLHLLTPRQLKAELQTIHSQSLGEVTLPITNIETELYHMYQLLKVKARVTKRFIIFEVTVPLIGLEKFQLYQILPIPHQIVHNMVTIVPVSEYVAVNLKKDAYFSVTIHELSTCLYREESYMCQLLKPILTIENDESFCDKNTPDQKCKTVKSMCVNKWTELHTTSQYFYFCCDVYTIKIICDDQVTARQLTRAGVISMNHKCIIKGKDFVLYSMQHQSNTITLTPDIYAPKIDQINHLINIQLPTEKTILPEGSNLSTEFENLGQQITFVKSNNAEWDELSSHDIHHYTINYVLVAVALSVAAAWLWWKGCCCQGSRASRRRENQQQGSVRPTPQPSSTSVTAKCVSRKQSTADPCQLSAVSDSEQNSESAVKLQNLAKRWPSVKIMKKTIDDNIV